MSAPISRICARLWLCFVVASGSAAGSLSAQIAPLSIDDALNVPSVDGVALSPDGSLLAYVACRPVPRDGRSYFLASGFGTWTEGCRVRVVRTRDGTDVAVNIGPRNSIGPAWSPDGRRLAYLSDRDGMARVWVADVRTGQARRVSPQVIRTGDFYREGGPQWSPDGRFLLVKILPVGMSLVEANRAIESSARVPSTQLATEEHEGEVNVRVYRSSGDVSEPPKHETSTAVPDTFVVSTRTIRYQGDVALMEVRTGAVRPLTRSANAIWYRFSPDGQFVAVVDSKGTLPSDAITFVHDLTIFRREDGKTVQHLRYVSPSYYTDKASWAPSGSLLAFAPCRFLRVHGGEIDLREVMGGRECGRYWAPGQDVLYALSADTADGKAQTAVWRVTPVTKEVVRIGTVPGHRGQWLLPRDHGRLWSPDGGRSAFVFTLDSLVATLTHRVDLASGRVRLVRRDDKLIGSRMFEITNRDASADSRAFVFDAESITEPEELWVTDSSFAAPRKLTRLNDHLAKYKFGTTQVISWRGGRNGVRHQGIVLLPPDYVPGRRYPVVTWVYPGFRMAYRNTFGGRGGGIWNFHLLATRGYVVFFPEVIAYEGTPISDIPASVLSGIDRLVELGIADSTRLGVAGHSQGGYSTMAIVTHTARFKAAMAYAGHYDPFRDYGELGTTGTAESVTRQERHIFPHIAMGGSPWEYRQRYIENNTLFYLDRVETPLLLVVGGLDGSMVGQAQAAFVGLRRLGKIAELALYPGEGHTMANLPNQRDYIERFIGWFDRYLRSDTGTTTPPQTPVPEARQR